MKNVDLIYTDNYKRIFLHFFSITKNKDLSEDLCQDLFIKLRIAVDKGQKFDSEKGCLNWLFRAGKNMFFDKYRKKRTSPVYNFLDEDEIIYNYKADPERTVESKLIHDELVQQALIGVQHLRPNFKETYQLHVLNGMKFKDVAFITGRKLNTVLGEMRYARIKLKKEIFN